MNHHLLLKALLSVSFMLTLVNYKTSKMPAITVIVTIIGNDFGSVVTVIYFLRSIKIGDFARYLARLACASVVRVKYHCSSSILFRVLVRTTLPYFKAQYPVDKVTPVWELQ